MNQLWAPWRMSYILSGEQPADECIFCAFPARGPEHFRQELILCATDWAYVILNKFPYTDGHLLVIPRSHVDDPTKLSAAEYAELGELLRRATEAVRAALGPHGFNLGMNLGKVAGAGIAQHCHWHVVPRWYGDTNFMPVLGDVKVMSDHLTATYERLLPYFRDLGEGPR